MDSKSATIGYFISYPDRDEEGIAETSLENLMKKCHHDKLPFVDSSKLKQIISDGGITFDTVNGINISSQYVENMGWSALSRFLYQLAENNPKLIEVPKDKLIITTNRKTIIEIIELVRRTKTGKISFKTKLRNRKYGRELALSYDNQQESQVFRKLVSRNIPIGLKFNSYLIKDSRCSAEENEKKFTLFSIHRLNVINFSFLYEAEIDAVGTINTTSNGQLYSVLEMKTYAADDSFKVKEAFEKYDRLSHAKNTNKRMSMDQDTLVGKNPRRDLLQGELGNVDRYIYGFITKGKITGSEFLCHPGIVLKEDLTHLHDFVKLLESCELISAGSGKTWAEWDYWELEKDNNNLILRRENEILAKEELWTLA